MFPILVAKLSIAFRENGADSKIAFNQQKSSFVNLLTICGSDQKVTNRISRPEFLTSTVMVCICRHYSRCNLPELLLPISGTLVRPEDVASAHFSGLHMPTKP
jgi:hypothetical protein